MKSPKHPCTMFETEPLPRQSWRPLIVALAVLIVVALAPILRSATPPQPAFTQTNLVSDITGLAQNFDPIPVNSWGLAVGLNGAIWVSDNGSGMATSLDGDGKPVLPNLIGIPSSRSSSGGASPTGVATNGTSGFVISQSGISAPASELFATEDGTIAAWNKTVNPTQAMIVVDNSNHHAVYKGLAMGFTSDGAFLYATNFHDGTVDVFDSKFQPAKQNKFKDEKIPNGYAPFGIAAINGALYVTYAMQDEDKMDDVPASGHGFIDVFDFEGNLTKRFVSQGQLNSPWGMVWTPFEGFGAFDNALLVGNFGDGTINAFDFDSGDFLGKVSDANGTPIKISGIWGLLFGLSVANASSSTLYFSAGIQAEKHGLFGKLTVNPPSSTEQPTLADSNLHVSTVVSGLDQPTSMVFLGPSDFLVLEKASGKVRHVVNGAIAATLLTLPVNSASERGLLGIALAPDFATSGFIYIYWTQSSTNTLSSNLADVPVLGNRVDRFIWNPAMQTLIIDRNIIRLRALQTDDGQPLRGNHDAGKILFGPDGKLYFQIGDQGRRGQLQNLAGGPSGTGKADDQYGGPAPDDAHLTGVIFRLNPDGSTPDDNPFAKLTVQDISKLEQQAGVTLTADQLTNVTANIRKIFSYGRRNGFGLAFDPKTGLLWESENGDDAMDEINQITAGSNGGWVQIMGPANSLSAYKGIEVSFTPLQGNLPVAGNLPLSALDPTTFIPAIQQIRWAPSLIADSPIQANGRLFMLPGAHYEDPEFSWKWAVAPSAIGFAGDALGPIHAGNLFVGESRTFLEGGYLFELKFDAGRKHFDFSGTAIKNNLDDNDYKFDEGQSSALLAGSNFGIVTNIVTGPDGALYVTSLSNGKVYKIHQ